MLSFSIRQVPIVLHSVLIWIWYETGMTTLNNNTLPPVYCLSAYDIGMNLILSNETDYKPVTDTWHSVRCIKVDTV